MESDRSCFVVNAGPIYFNPRSPMESDLVVGSKVGTITISIHALLWRATSLTELVLPAVGFQSTLSYGERQQKYVKKTSKIYLFINFTTLSKVSLVVYFIYFLFTTFLEFFLGANLLRFFCVL